MVVEVKHCLQAPHSHTECNELEKKMNQFHQKLIFMSEDTVNNHGCQDNKFNSLLQLFVQFLISLLNSVNIYSTWIPAKGRSLTCIKKRMWVVLRRLTRADLTPVLWNSLSHIEDRFCETGWLPGTIPSWARGPRISNKNSVNWRHLKILILQLRLYPQLILVIMTFYIIDYHFIRFSYRSSNLTPFSLVETKWAWPLFKVQEPVGSLKTMVISGSKSWLWQFSKSFIRRCKNCQLNKLWTQPDWEISVKLVLFKIIRQLIHKITKEKIHKLCC